MSENTIRGKPGLWSHPTMCVTAVDFHGDNSQFSWMTLGKCCLIFDIMKNLASPDLIGCDLSTFYSVLKWTLQSGPQFLEFAKRVYRRQPQTKIGIVAYTVTYYMCHRGIQSFINIGTKNISFISVYLGNWAKYQSNQLHWRKNPWVVSLCRIGPI